MRRANAKLTSISLERFKSFEERVKIDLAPLTIIHGRNNGGKSSIIQSLLLLKQTLADPRSDVPLRLDGVVDAFSVRELTWGWPAAADEVQGPRITLKWESEVDLNVAREEARRPDMSNFVALTGVDDFTEGQDHFRTSTALSIEYAEVRGSVQIKSLKLVDGRGRAFDMRNRNGRWSCRWRSGKKREYWPAHDIEVELHHFIPYLRIDRGALGPRDKQRAWHNAYVFLFAQPLEALVGLLADLQSLGSTREPPPSLYRISSTAPQEVGVSGEFAAQLLHRRQGELVHYLPPLNVDEASEVKALPLVDAVNDVLGSVSIDAPLRVDEIQNVGFRLLFGEASIAHVGRGLTYLLPLIELGLIADPLRFSGASESMSLADYIEQCGAYTHVAVEEPEAHLHPKVQSRLAHWLVSLAMANRRLIVETHSDHLVRRLRGLVARAGRGSELEQWLLDNVIILGVEQDAEGRSTVTSSRLTAEGGVGETWPADFMDEASSEESAIYYAGLDKGESNALTTPAGLEFDDGEEPDGEAP